MRIIIRVNKNIWKNEKFMKLLEELSSPEMVNFPQSPFGLEIKEEDSKNIPTFIKERFAISSSLSDEEWEKHITEKKQLFINLERMKCEAKTI